MCSTIIVTATAPSSIVTSPSGLRIARAVGVEVRIGRGGEAGGGEGGGTYERPQTIHEDRP